MIDFKNANVKKLTDFIRSGCKDTLGKTGIECEHFIVDENNEAVSFYGKNGVEEILNRLREFYPNQVFSNNYLVGLDDGVTYITLEPASQIEVSIIPMDSLSEIEKTYNSFLQRISNILKSLNYSLITSGYQPSSKVDLLPLIPKGRYEMMDSYFLSKGNRARYMMRGSASVQVNIDYLDETDFVKKFTVANALSPIFYLITDNSTVFEGEAYKGYSLRSWIWEQVDSSRCGFLKCNSFEDYARWIYSMEPIFIQEEGKDIFTHRRTNEELFSGKEITENDIKHILSMAFPNVRAKQFIEIRTGDSLPVDLMLSYAALIKGILYNKSAVDELYNQFSDVSVEDMKKQMSLIREKGFECDFYGNDMKFILTQLFSYAENGLTGDERCYLSTLCDISLDFKTPKEI